MRIIAVHSSEWPNPKLLHSTGTKMLEKYWHLSPIEMSHKPTQKNVNTAAHAQNKLINESHHIINCACPVCIFTAARHTERGKVSRDSKQT